MTVLPWCKAPMLGFALALALAANAFAAPPPITSSADVLVTATGMTLYTYDADGASGASRCNGACATIWPSLLADAGSPPAPGFALVMRSDHTLQWSYHGRPLYLYHGDTKPGEARGDGINGVWHVARAH